MNPKRIYAVFLRQMYLYKGNPTRLASVLVWIVFDLIQWGFISKYIGTFGQATFSFITVILGAIILWDFMSRVQQGVMTSFLEDIWSQNFINFFASPLEIREYVGGLVATSIVTGFIGFLGMVVLAGIAFGYNIFILGLYILPFLIILFISGVAVGIFVAAVIFRLGPSAEWLGWPIPFVLSIFSGVYYPISTLPVSLQLVARILPTSYVFESVRRIVITHAFTSDLGINLFVGTALALVYLVFMYRLFIKVYRFNLKTGGIARFGAESI